VPEAAMRADLLQTLQIVTQLRVERGGEQLRELAVRVVLLSVEEPVGHLVLARVGHDGDQLLHLFVGELAGPLVEVDVGLLDDEVGVAPADSLHRRQGVHDLGLAVNVGVHDTQNMLKLGGDDERHGCKLSFFKKLLIPFVLE